MRWLLVLMIASCGSNVPESAAPASEEGPAEVSEGEESAGFESHEPAADPIENPSAADVSCRADCTRGESTCGRWVGRDPMTWEACPPVCCDPSNPASAKSVTLRELAQSVERDNASATISSLGGHRISPQCVGVEWEPLSNARERGTCDAGWVHLGEVRAHLDLLITRVVDNPDASGAVLVLRAETPGEGWKRAMRTAVRAAWDEILGEMAEFEEMRPDQLHFELGQVRLVLQDDGARLARISRSLRR
ncbi:MAG: hypothetical protein AAGE52_03330 [Myxococcota bacterium]